MSQIRNTARKALNVREEQFLNGQC